MFEFKTGKAVDFKSYLNILRRALFNQPQSFIVDDENVTLDKTTIRSLFKKAYPKAKV